MSKEANKSLTLDVYPRTGSGKNAAYKTRSKNLIPAVVYGSKLVKGDEHTGLSVSLDPKNFLKVYQVSGRSSLVDIALQDGAPAELAGSKVLIKALQTNPLKREVLHVDILQLDMSKELRVVVPLKFVGKAKGLNEGGILSIMVRQVEIKCLPADIPHEIEVDVSEVDVNESIHIHQLSEKLKDKVKYEFIFDSDYTLCGVQPPEEEKVETPVEAAATDAAAAPAAGGAAPAAAAAAAPAKDAKK